MFWTHVGGFWPSTSPTVAWIPNSQTTTAVITQYPEWGRGTDYRIPLADTKLQGCWSPLYKRAKYLHITYPPVSMKSSLDHCWYFIQRKPHGKAASQQQTQVSLCGTFCRIFSNTFGSEVDWICRCGNTQVSTFRFISGPEVFRGFLTNSIMDWKSIPAEKEAREDLPSAGFSQDSKPIKTPFSTQSHPQRGRHLKQ